MDESQTVDKPSYGYGRAKTGAERLKSALMKRAAKKNAKPAHKPVTNR